MTLSILLVNPVYASTAQKKILAFGDSLTLGYNISLENTFPAQLERKLKKQGYDITVINAGEAGDTTSGGATRLEWTLKKKKPDFVILELGSNDVLRAIDPKITYSNLHKMMRILKKHEIPVLLTGMKASPNMGEDLEKMYFAMYENLAKKYNAVYYPFFLEGISSNKDLFQKNKIHPNETGVTIIVNNIFPFVEKLLAFNQPPHKLPE